MARGVTHKGIMDVGHSTLTGDQLHEPFSYVQSSDPGAVGSGKYWLDTTSSPFVLKRRNSTDTGWDIIGTNIVITGQEGDVDVDTAVKTIDFDASDFNVGSSPAGEINVSLAYGTSAGTPAEGNHTHALDALSDVNTGAMAGEIAGKQLVWVDSASEWQDRWVYVVTYGPYFLNDVPGTATTQAQLMMFNTATAVSLTTREVQSGTTGYIVGMSMVTDNPRTAGTAAARILLSGVDTQFDSDACILDATFTAQKSRFVAPASGIRLTGSSVRIGVNIVTSGWTPTTANIAVWVHVMYDPIA